MGRCGTEEMMRPCPLRLHAVSFGPAVSAQFSQRLFCDSYKRAREWLRSAVQLLDPHRAQIFSATAGSAGMAGALFGGGRRGLGEPPALTSSRREARGL